MNKNYLNFILRFWAGQKVWLALVSMLAGLYIYSQVTGFRWFNTTGTEKWKPEGRNSSIHHK